MPISQVYNALQTGLIDGVFTGASTLSDFKLEEVANSYTIGAPLGRLVFYTELSQAKYDALSDSQKAAIDAVAGAQLAIVTQFAFEAQPVIDWANRLTVLGVTIPIHVGIAGPAKLQTLIKFAIACGVGPSLMVLKKRAKDLSKLLLPFEPDEIVAEFGGYIKDHPDSLIQKLHFFPLGGIKTNATWIGTHS